MLVVVLVVGGGGLMVSIEGSDHERASTRRSYNLAHTHAHLRTHTHTHLRTHTRKHPHPHPHRLKVMSDIIIKLSVFERAAYFGRSIMTHEQHV